MANQGGTAGMNPSLLGTGFMLSAHIQSYTGVFNPYDIKVLCDIQVLFERSVFIVQQTTRQGNLP